MMRLRGTGFRLNGGPCHPSRSTVLPPTGDPRDDCPAARARSKLSADGLQTTGIISQGPRIEGQAIFKLANGSYALWGSHLTGWAPNPAWMSISTGTTLNGAKWVDANPQNPSGDSTTYNSQVSVSAHR